MNYLSVCGIVRGERYLEEWVEYHRTVGVEHFYIYDNGAFAGSFLKKQVSEGFVTVIPFPGKCQQLNAYNHCLRNFKNESRWIAFIDADEFLVPNKGSDLRNVLRNYEQYGGLAVNWLIFGSSYHILRPIGFQIENYTHRARNDYAHKGEVHNQLVKSIVQPSHTIAVSTNPHIFLYEEGYYCVNEKFERVSGPISKNTTETIQLNHYYTRSYQDFREKIIRGRADVGGSRSWDEFFEVDYYANAVWDYRILRFLPELKKRLNRNSKMNLGSKVPVGIRRLARFILFCQFKITRRLTKTSR
jgi:hypothetical protein